MAYNSNGDEKAEKEWADNTSALVPGDRDSAGNNRRGCGNDDRSGRSDRAGRRVEAGPSDPDRSGRKGEAVRPRGVDLSLSTIVRGRHNACLVIVHLRRSATI